MKKYLKIKQPERFIYSRGRNIRTPCTVEIKDMEEVIEIVRNGNIPDGTWKIIDEKDGIIYKSKMDKKGERKIKKDKLTEILDILKKQNEEINTLKNILDNKNFTIYTDQKIKESTKEEFKEKSKEDFDIEEEIEFIPNIDIKDIEIEDKNTIKIDDDKSSIDDIVENLKKMKNK